MRAIVSVLFLVVVFPATVWAQPGQTPPEPPVQEPYPPQPYPPQPYPPQPYPPQPYPPQSYPPQPYYPYPVQLTPEEQKLLSRGEISSGQHIGGVVANWLLGFGIGQAVQGRWSDTGWIFTVGEAGSLAVLIAGALRLDPFCNEEFGSCDQNDEAGVLLVGGLVGYVVFHVWSLVDAAAGPPNHNRKVRDLRSRVGIPVLGSRQLVPYAGPSRDGGGTVGLTLRF